MNSSVWGKFAFPLLLGALVTGIAIAVRPFGVSDLMAACMGLSGAIVASVLAVSLSRTTTLHLIGGFLGLSAGSLLGLVFVVVSNTAGLNPSSALTFFHLTVPVLLSYVGLLIGISKWREIPIAGKSSQQRAFSGKILDTSVLIDGRISDIVESGFLEGPFIVPRFVLHELQSVADSADSARRARGRRGLDVVQYLQKIPHLTVEVSSQDFPAIREVDLKLIELAKLRAAKIVTNDFNLNKLAQVQGISVLNTNELASSLKAIVLPGEVMRVFILKEGKEHNQGIAYLNDGTMVVVDNARRMISKNIDVVVTSVLQTTAGKMIFGRYDANVHTEPGAVAASFSATASSST